MNIYTLLALFVGMLIGANFGFIIASFMRANDEEEYKTLAEDTEHDDKAHGRTAACFAGNIKLLDQLGRDTFVHPQADERDPESAGGEAGGGVTMDNAISRKGTSAWLENMGYSYLAKVIMDEKRFPSVVPKKGKWIYHIDDLFPAESTMECNQCHAEQPLTCDDEFCPHCGAKMEVTE